MSGRALVLWCPDWPVTAARTLPPPDLAPPPPPGPTPPDPTAPPALLAVTRGGRVLACCADARAAGVRRGLREREAQSCCPGLVLVPDDPQRDARAFEPLVAALEQVVPGVQLLRPGLVAVRARGPARFYGGEAQAARVLLDTLAAHPGADGAPQPARAGVADDLFTAEQAARATTPGEPVRVVEAGAGPAFLAPLPVTVLEHPELADLLVRLGVRTLGDLASLEEAEVRSRFGDEGVLAHRRAGGCADHPVRPRTPPPDLVRTVDLEPPLELVEQVAFAVRAAADDLMDRLRRLSLVCTAIGVEVSFSPGAPRLARTWVHPRWLTAADVIDRLRWQLSGTGSLPGPVSRVRLVPEQVDPLAAHAEPLWGGSPQEEVMRAVSRVQGMLGHRGVGRLTLAGGRGPRDRQRYTPWGEQALGVAPRERPWPGSLPAPAPTVVHPRPLPALVLTGRGSSVQVDDRGLLDGPPAVFGLDGPGGGTVPVDAWAGPWPVTERWWDPGRAHRWVRLQLVGVDGRAWLVLLEGGRWLLEAEYG